MAIYYVWSGAAGAANGTSWVNAYTKLATAIASKGANDVFYVAHDHAEVTATTVTITFPAASSSITPMKVICVDRAGTVPPVAADRRATAQITATGAGNMTIGGHGHFDGIIFNSGDSTSGTVNIIFNNSTGAAMRYDNCSFRLFANVAGAGTIKCGNTSAGNLTELYNCTMWFSHATQSIAAWGQLRWRGGALQGAGVPDILFTLTSVAGGDIECSGVDLSAAGAGKTLCGSHVTAYSAKFRFIDCKLNPAVTRSVVPAAPWAHDADFVRCGPTYMQHRQDIVGIMNEEAGIVRTSGGASDETTAVSWKIATNGNCHFNSPYETPPIAFWNEVTGTPKTATIEGIWPIAALPLDDEIWIDLQYLTDPSAPLAAFANDGKPGVVGAGTAQTTSSEPWAALGAPVTYDPATVANVTLSGGNLVATNTGTTSADQGARVDTAYGKTSGKIYWEVVRDTAGSGSNNACGIGTTSATYTTLGANGTNGAIVNTGGAIWVNGTNSGVNIGTLSTTSPIGIAVDLDARLIWFRHDATSPWNNNAANNPATGVGGLTIPAGTMVPFLTFGGPSGQTAQKFTTRFGEVPMVATVPSGFTAGWSGPPGTRFKLSTTFTPQQKGWVYARVKVAKPIGTFYVDPLVTVT